jgi:hypothetical protein
MNDSFYSLHLRRFVVLASGHYLFYLLFGPERSENLPFVVLFYFGIAAAALLMFRSQGESRLVWAPLFVFAFLLALNRFLDPIYLHLVPLVEPALGETWGIVLLTLLLFNGVALLYFLAVINLSKRRLPENPVPSGESR